MPTIKKDILVLVLALLLVIGAGSYLTYVQQPAEMERLEKAEKLEKMKRSELTSLISEYSSSKRQANEIVSKWRSRYKVIPDTLSSAEIIGTVNDLTRTGFENFDVNVGGIERTPDYSYYRMRASGRGYFSSLYRFIWNVENSRQLYNIRNLKLDHLDLETQDEDTGRKRLQVMVSFDLEVNAYFGGPESASAGRGGYRPDSEGVPVAQSGIPQLPGEVLADRDPDVNPFFPVIMESIPPNTRGLVNVETAEFVSIVDGQAIFKDGEGYRKVGVGDGVYLGQITGVDPMQGRVTARLNKGGILDRVELNLNDAQPTYRQAVGPTQLESADSEADGSGGDASAADAPDERPVPDERLRMDFDSGTEEPR